MELISIEMDRVTYEGMLATSGLSEAYREEETNQRNPVLHIYLFTPSPSIYIYAFCHLP